jgi:hypothetical protein
VALWGVSFSGGHVLTVASLLGGQVAAVVANEPYLASSSLVLKELRHRGLLKVRLAWPWPWPGSRSGGGAQLQSRAGGAALLPA